MSSTKSLANLFELVISVCNPATKSATLKSTSLPFSSVNITFFVVLSYLPLTTTLSNGKSIVSVLIIVPSRFFSFNVIMI